MIFSPLCRFFGSFNPYSINVTDCQKYLYNLKDNKIIRTKIMKKNIDKIIFQIIKSPVSQKKKSSEN